MDKDAQNDQKVSIEGGCLGAECVDLPPKYFTYERPAGGMPVGAIENEKNLPPDEDEEEEGEEDKEEEERKCAADLKIQGVNEEDRMQVDEMEGNGEQCEVDCVVIEPGAL